MSRCHAHEWEVNLSQKFLKDRAENGKGPLGCYIMWNSVLKRLG